MCYSVDTKLKLNDFINNILQRSYFRIGMRFILPDKMLERFTTFLYLYSMHTVLPKPIEA